MKKTENPLPSLFDTNAPKYWMWESSGVLKPVVEAYLRGEDLLPGQLSVMRAYLRQWIMSPAWDMNPHLGLEGDHGLQMLRDLVEGITSMPRLRDWLIAALDLGIDPL